MHSLDCVYGPIRLSVYLGRYIYEILSFHVKDCLQWHDLDIDLQAATMVLGLRPRANT